MSKVVARSYFDTVGNSADPGVTCRDASLAVQASKQECDINFIVNKYLRTGEMPGHRQGVFADLSEFTDLRDAIHIVNEAQQAFMELPAEVRKEFDNDPTKLVEFASDLSDPKKFDRALELGLVERAPAAPPKAAAPAPSESTPKGVPPKDT